MENDAWKSLFHIDKNSNGQWLVMEKGKLFSYNCILYKTQGGAKKGARAAYNKIQKHFETSFLK